MSHHPNRPHSGVSRPRSNTALSQSLQHLTSLDGSPASGSGSTSGQSTPRRMASRPPSRAGSPGPTALGLSMSAPSSNGIIMPPPSSFTSQQTAHTPAAVPKRRSRPSSPIASTSLPPYPSTSSSSSSPYPPNRSPTTRSRSGTSIGAPSPLHHHPHPQYSNGSTSIPIPNSNTDVHPSFMSTPQGMFAAPGPGGAPPGAYFAYPFFAHHPQSMPPNISGNHPSSGDGADGSSLGLGGLRASYSSGHLPYMLELAMQQQRHQQQQAEALAHAQTNAQAHAQAHMQAQHQAQSMSMSNQVSSGQAPPSLPPPYGLAYTYPSNPPPDASSGLQPFASSSSSSAPPTTPSTPPLAPALGLSNARSSSTLTRRQGFNSSGRTENRSIPSVRDLNWDPDRRRDHRYDNGASSSMSRSTSMGDDDDDDYSFSDDEDDEALAFLSSPSSGASAPIYSRRQKRIRRDRQRERDEEFSQLESDNGDVVDDRSHDHLERERRVLEDEDGRPRDRDIYVSRGPIFLSLSSLLGSRSWTYKVPLSTPILAYSPNQFTFQRLLHSTASLFVFPP